MTQIEFIIELFKYLDYEFIDERTMRSYNQLFYHNGNLVIDVNFNYDTGEISTIGEGVYEANSRESYFRGVLLSYLKRLDQNKLRDFKLTLIDDKL